MLRTLAWDDAKVPASVIPILWKMIPTAFFSGLWITNASKKPLMILKNIDQINIVDIHFDLFEKGKYYYSKFAFVKKIWQD